VNAAPSKVPVDNKGDNSPSVTSPPFTPLEKAETKYDNDARYYLRHILTEEQCKLFIENYEASSAGKFQLRLMEEGVSPKEAAIFHACAFFGIDLGAENPSEKDIAIINAIGAAANQAEALLDEFEGHNTSLNDGQLALRNVTINTVKDEYGFEFDKINNRGAVTARVRILFVISKSEVQYSGFQIVVSAPLFFVRPDFERTELLSEAIRMALALDPDTDDFLATHDLV
jgi:hypothetical protein